MTSAQVPLSRTPSCPSRPNCCFLAPNFRHLEVPCDLSHCISLLSNLSPFPEARFRLSELIRGEKTHLLIVSNILSYKSPTQRLTSRTCAVQPIETKGIGSKTLVERSRRPLNHSQPRRSPHPEPAPRSRRIPTYIQCPSCHAPSRARASVPASWFRKKSLFDLPSGAMAHLLPSDNGGIHGTPGLARRTRKTSRSWYVTRHILHPRNTNLA
jgi:hypothetical protein